MSFLKFGVGVALSSILLFAGEFENKIESLLKKEIGMESEVVKSLDIDEGLKFVIVEAKKTGMRLPIFATSNGNSILGYTKEFFTSRQSVTKKIEQEIEALMEHNKKTRDKEIQKLIARIPQNAIIKLDNKKDKTLVVISDPECPYCRNELRNIEKRLKEANVYMILAPVHGKSAFIKSELIYQKTAKVRSSDEKIEIIRKYFDPKVNLSSEELKIEPTITEKNANIIFNSGLIRGVPFVFELSK